MAAAISRRQAWLVGWLFVQAGVCGGALRASDTIDHVPSMVGFFATVFGAIALTDRLVGRTSRAPGRGSDRAVVGAVALSIGLPLALALSSQGGGLVAAVAVWLPAAAVMTALAAAVGDRIRYPTVFWAGLAVASGFVHLPSSRSDLSWLAVFGCSAPGFALMLGVAWLGWGADIAPGRVRRLAGALGVGATVGAARVWTAFLLREDRQSDDGVELWVFLGTFVFPMLAPALIERLLGEDPPVNDVGG